MKKTNLEFRVGVFVLVALAVLAWLVMKAGDFSFEPGYVIRVKFDSVSGVEAGSPVRLAGVPVGEVKAIQVVRTPEGGTQVEITAWITQGAYIEEDAQIRINSLGLLGEKYVEITPGASGTRTLSDGGQILGKTPVGMEQITESGSRLIRKLEFAVDNINQVVGDQGFQGSVKGAFDKAEGAFGSAETVMTDLKEVTADLKDSAKSVRIVTARLRDGEGTVGRLLKDDTIAKDLEAFVKDIKAHPWKLLKRN